MQFLARFVSGLGFALSSYRKVGTMPEKDFYLIIILSVVIGLLLIRTLMTRVERRRKSRRIQQGLAEYLRKQSHAKIAVSE